VPSTDLCPVYSPLPLYGPPPFYGPLPLYVPLSLYGLCLLYENLRSLIDILYIDITLIVLN
jgi:hypothetical protein